jgi:hypothetical protein
MAFLCTFAGRLAALTIWTGLYAVASESRIPLLRALAPYLEALSPFGEALFVILAVTISLLLYRWLKPKLGKEPPDPPNG